MSFGGGKKSQPQAPAPRPKAAIQRAPEVPEGDSPTVTQKRKNRRRGLRTVLTQGDQTVLGATSGRSLLG